MLKITRKLCVNSHHVFQHRFCTWDICAISCSWQTPSASHLIPSLSLFYPNAGTLCNPIPYATRHCTEHRQSTAIRTLTFCYIFTPIVHQHSCTIFVRTLEFLWTQNQRFTQSSLPSIKHFLRNNFSPKLRFNYAFTREIRTLDNVSIFLYFASNIFADAEYTERMRAIRAVSEHFICGFIFHTNHT